MKIEIWNEPAEEEAVLRLRLVKGLGNDDYVTLVAVDKDGEECVGGRLMDISFDGFHSWGFVDDKIGLPLEGDNDRVVVANTPR